MVNYYKKYSWVIVVMLLIIGGTIYVMVTGGAGFQVGTDSEKIGIVSGDNSLFVWYKDMESVNLIDIPDVGTGLSGSGTGNNTVYGPYKNDKYGEYTAYLYTKQSQCLEITYEDGKILLVNDSTTSKTNKMYDTISGYVNKEGE